MPLRSFQTSKTNLIMERWWISAYSNIILYGLPRSTLSFRCWRAQYQVLENLSGWTLWLPCSAKVHREFVLFNSHQAYPELVVGFKLQAWRSAGLLAATGSSKWFRMLNPLDPWTLRCQSRCDWVETAAIWQLPDAKCPSGQEQKKPWRTAKQTFLSHLGQNARDEVEEDKALKKRLQALRESQRLGQGAMPVLRVQGLQAFGMATNKMGYERAAYLALAVTAVLSGWEPRGTDMCKLKLQVERAMSSGIGAASAASSSVGEERRVRRPVRKGHTKKKQKESAAAQHKHSTPVLLRSLAAMCKRRPRPPFHALSDDVQQKAMPSKPFKEVNIRTKAAPPVGPPAKAMPKVKEENERSNEIKEELL